MQAWGGMAWGQQAGGTGQGAGEGTLPIMEKYSEERVRNQRDEGRVLRSLPSSGRDLEFCREEGRRAVGHSCSSTRWKRFSQHFWERRASKGRADSMR